MLRDLFKKRTQPRVLSDRSTRELTDRKKRLRSELCASVYLYKDSKFIVCSIAGSTEQREPTVLDVSEPDEVLGLTLCDKLLEFQPREDPDRPERKLEDWAAYVASGAKSGRAFESNSIFVYVATINTAIRIEAAPRITNERELKALCTVTNSQSHSEIGAAVRKAVKAAQLLRGAGVL